MSPWDSDVADDKRPVDIVTEYNVSLMAKGKETEACYKSGRQEGTFPDEGISGLLVSIGK